MATTTTTTKVAQSVSVMFVKALKESKLEKGTFVGFYGPTGYYETLANEKPWDKAMAFTDDKGRHGLLLPVKSGNIVIFQRYAETNSPIVVNLPKEVSFLTHVWGMDSTMSKQIFANLFSYFYTTDEILVSDDYENWPIVRLASAMR